MIHKSLKSGGRIAETKGHDHELIVTLMGVKLNLGNFFIFHMYLVVAKT
jgi:hypothetical protein